MRCLVIVGREQCPHKAVVAINKIALCKEHAEEMRKEGHVNLKRPLPKKL